MHSQKHIKLYIFRLSVFRLK